MLKILFPALKKGATQDSKYTDNHCPQYFETLEFNSSAKRLVFRKGLK